MTSAGVNVGAAHLAGVSGGRGRERSVRLCSGCRVALGGPPRGPGGVPGSPGVRSGHRRRVPSAWRPPPGPGRACPPGAARAWSAPAGPARRAAWRGEVSGLRPAASGREGARPSAPGGPTRRTFAQSLGPSAARGRCGFPGAEALRTPWKAAAAAAAGPCTHCPGPPQCREHLPLRPSPPLSPSGVSG